MTLTPTDEAARAEIRTLVEEDDGNRYEVWTVVKGRKFSRVIRRDEATESWPICTPDLARESVRQAAFRHEVTAK